MLHYKRILFCYFSTLFCLPLSLGEHDIRNRSPNEQKFDIAEVIMHPQYDSITANNDMVLLRLHKKASYTNYVRPACFPDATTTRFTSGEECYVTGWGALQTKGASPRVCKMIFNR